MNESLMTEVSSETKSFRSTDIVFAVGESKHIEFSSIVIFPYRFLIGTF